MSSGHVGFFEAEEQVTVQVRIALGVDEERVADAALSMRNVFLERERSRSSGSPLAAAAPLPNRPASSAGPPSARVIRCVTRVSIRRRTVPLPVRAGSVSARGVLVNRTTEGAHHAQLHWLVAHYLRPGPCPEIDRRVSAVKFPANDLHRCRAMNGPHIGSCTGRSKPCTRPGIAHQRPTLRRLVRFPT
jgi:hypothetical protein